MPQAMRRLLVKLVVLNNSLPTSFYIQGVAYDGSESFGSDAFTDLYRGVWSGKAVALKRFRVEGTTENPETRVSFLGVLVLDLECSTYEFLATLPRLPYVAQARSPVYPSLLWSVCGCFHRIDVCCDTLGVQRIYS